MGLEAKAKNFREKDPNPNRHDFRRLKEGGSVEITRDELDAVLLAEKPLPYTKGIIYTHDGGVGVNEEGITG